VSLPFTLEKHFKAKEKFMKISIFPYVKMFCLEKNPLKETKILLNIIAP
jgi:hypothetical protein